MSTGPARSTVHPMPTVDHSARRAPATPRAIAAETIGATRRRSSQHPRATLSRRGGRKVRSSSNSVVARRRRTGGDPSHEDPRLAFFGTADSTATSASRGTERPAPVMPELPRNARRPTLERPMRTKPPPSSYVATIVSSARNAPEAICVSEGMRSTVEISVSRPTRAPSTRNHSGVTSEGVEREQERARRVEHALGAPRLPARTRPDARVPALVQAEGEQPDRATTRTA